MVQNSATFARDIRARQARRKELKRLLREVLPQNLPEVLIPKILTWVGYDLIHNFPGEYCYRSEFDTAGVVAGLGLRVRYR